jgi:hypothetical protein
MNESNFATPTNVVNPLVQGRREASVIKNFDVLCA